MTIDIDPLLNDPYALTILISIVANLILLGLATIEHIIRERRKLNV